MPNNDSFIIYVLGPALGAFLTWLFTRKKQHADVSVSISEAAHTSIESLILVVDELKQKIDDGTKEIWDLKLKTEDLIVENELLKIELQEVKDQNNKLLEENTKLRIEIHKLNNKLNSM